MKLHTKILLGLALGATAGVAVNMVAADAGWLAWINRYVTGPVGQIFLRLLFMVVMPLVFATLAGVAGLGDHGTSVGSGQARVLPGHDRARRGRLVLGTRSGRGRPAGRDRGAAP
jgi:Na+/H+-dicarboxylate symporter